MKVFYSLAFLLFIGFISSCGDGACSVDVNAEQVSNEATKEMPAVSKGIQEVEGEMSASDVVKKQLEMDGEREIDPLRGSEYNAPYICVDHCKNSGSAAPGKCRTCKKEYVKNVNYIKRKPPGY